MCLSFLGFGNLFETTALSMKPSACVPEAHVHHFRNLPFEFSSRLKNSLNVNFVKLLKHSAFPLGRNISPANISDKHSSDFYMIKPM